MNRDKTDIPVRDDRPEEEAEVKIEQPRENNRPETEQPDEVTDWQAEADKYRDLYLRTKAETENMKRRLEKEKTDFIKFANESLIKDILPVVDNLERALKHSESSSNGDQGISEGVRLTYEGLKNALEKFGVKPVEAMGEPFDPNFHEAMMQRDDPEVEANTVLEEIQKGYLLHDRLIRPSMVVVSRKPADDGE